METVRTSFLIILLSLSLSSFQQKEGYSKITDRDKFNLGEELQFDLGYGWFTLGKADLKVANTLVPLDNKSCYEVEIKGRTTGLLGTFSKVDDAWGGFVDHESMLPLSAYADLQEGKYQRKEDIQYDYETGEIRIDMIKRQKPKPTKYYPIEEELYDLISGYLKIRNLDYSNMNIGDTVKFKAFYDEIYYDLGVLYEGIETVKTPVGKLKAHRIIPIIPKNKIFTGTNPIVAWISADPNQLPLKIEANMFFGHAFVELTNYKNIKYGPNFN
ncbi:MAG: hypothetical protein ACJAZM_000549 [Cyclobacteriaceae bacterium]|jgi:hypothetical protein